MSLPPLPPDQVKVPSKKNEPIWATVILGRKPEFKVHSQLAHAKNAVNGMSYAFGPRRQRGLGAEAWVYRLVEGEWKPWFYVDHSEHPFVTTPSKGIPALDSDYQLIIQELPI